nr:hypothetical protein [Tanacetum cinerariifolium]
MLNKSSEKHPIGKTHIGDIGYTNHSIDNVVDKIEVLSNGKTVEHAAETSIEVVLVPYDLYLVDHVMVPLSEGKSLGSCQVEKDLSSQLPLLLLLLPDHLSQPFLLLIKEKKMILFGVNHKITNAVPAPPMNPPNTQDGSMEWEIWVLHIPPFVNNDINEFETDASNRRVVFNDGRVYNVRRFGLNKKKKFGSSSTGHVKMRGKKTKGGRLFPAQRLGRMGSWLGIDGAISDTIKETEPYQSFMPVIKNPSNFPRTRGKFPSDSGKISSTSGKFSTNRGIIPVNSGYPWSSILSSH